MPMTCCDALDDTEDPSLVALSLIQAAWHEGEENGVTTEQMAYAALFTALSDLVTLFGEDAVIKLTDGLQKRVISGEFTMDRTIQ